MSIIKMILNTKNKKILAVLLIVALGVVIFIVLKPNPTDRTDLTVTESGQEINLNPPTEDEENSGDEVKSEIVEREKARNNSANSGSEKRQVTPVITYADQVNPKGHGPVEVGAYVGNVFEDEGICTLTLSRGDVTRNKDVKAVKGAQSMDCPVMSVDTSGLVAGTWTATVSYGSSSSYGTSVTRSINVE